MGAVNTVVPLTLVPRLIADVPPRSQTEAVLRLRLRLESPACALNQDPEAAVSELRCPVCGATGTWEDEATTDTLHDAPVDAVDSEPYIGRKTASGGVWLCRRGHETREPIRPRKEPRGRRMGARSRKPPAAGRNEREDSLTRLCDAERRFG